MLEQLVVSTVIDVSCLAFLDFLVLGRPSLVPTGYLVRWISVRVVVMRRLSLAPPLALLW